MNSNFPYNVGANRLMVAEVNRDIILPTEYKDSNHSFHPRREN